MAKSNKKGNKGSKPAAPVPAVDPQTAAINNLFGAGTLEASNAFNKQVGTEGQFLGRVGEETPGQQEYLDKLKAGLGGYTSPEYQAQREQMQQGVNSQFATASNQLAKAQARGKVYGAAGAAQQANLIQGAENSKNDLEQKLMVQNINEMQTRLNNYGTQNAAAQQANLERQKVNMANAGAETATRAESLSGIGGLNIQKAQAAAANQIAKKGIAAIGGGGSHQSKTKVKSKTKGK